MQNLMTKIAKHQKLIGKYRPFDPLQDQMPYINTLSLGLIVEVSEMLDTLDWKEWKIYPTRDCGIQQAQARECVSELEDIMIFLLDIWLIVDPAVTMDEVVAAVANKIEYNINRLDHKKGGGV